MGQVAKCKLRSPLKTHGGKSYLARRIIALMPPHRTYCEPFLGGGSVLLNKAPAEIEIAADIDPDLINFWCVLAAEDDFLGAHLQHVRYDAADFEASAKFLDHHDFRVRALHYLVRNRMSRGGLGKDFAWSARTRGKRRSDGPVPGDVNAWETFLESLPAIRRRIAAVRFRCSGYTDTFRSCDSPSTLFYCDPPYLPATRTQPNVYRYEMTQDGHVAFLTKLRTLDGIVLVSGYRDSLYDDLLAGWERFDFEMPNHSGQGKTKGRRVESVWRNRG